MTPDTEAALEHCPHLPTMPGIATRIIDMGRDPEVDIADLAALLVKDPALASRILRVSNSPLYGQRRRSDNIRQAVMVLGLNTTMTLALSFSLADALRGRGDGRAMRLVWRRALIAATACRILGEEIGHPGKEEFFLAGLLQDIGILALEVAVPELYEPLVTEADTHDALVALESVHLQSGHCAVGAWLMERWGLPRYLVNTVLGSHDPETDAIPDEDRELARCVALSGRIADLFLHDSDRAESSARLADAASVWLGLGGDAVAAVIDRVGEGLPEAARLFDTRLPSARVAAGVIEEAREMLMMRNLQLLQETSEQRRRFHELERTAKHWEEVANHDPLTGVYNRRYFDERMAHEFALATESGWPLSIGFVDLDQFKSVNDHHGHQVGDQVLVGVAELMAARLRQRDLVVRYGGEEFLVLLPGTTLSDAMAVCERLRSAVAAVAHQDGEGRPFHITTSIGVAAHMDAGRCYPSVDVFIGAADQALNLAKAHGRDRVRPSPDTPTTNRP
ncbi:hypothetical protein KBTX_03675 [wastewater metagenome]|uniref:GGDEF domain n=2 Tax=unclassified sequences TaxID=12908 RepID=A0A5B8RFG5_9ZZZZ|nr:GGDEF domain-containing protein [Arhodomonas sp. KWT]QEA07326.1 hypothetical protein KBTEX_03675 [uncultured organism]